jgi:hypothetical protein
MKHQTMQNLGLLGAALLVAASICGGRRESGGKTAN